MGAPLRRADLQADPLAQFALWWDARAAASAQFPDSVVLATADAEGRPHARVVLLRGFGADGFRFFTNRGSGKGRELSLNPYAALLVYDEAHGRQIRIEGPVRHASDAESDAYWAARPRGSRLSAAVSRQSEPVEGRKAMEAAREAAAARYGDEIPRPAHWGGYVVSPSRYEFWQHRDDRFHDRFVYEHEGAGWRISRLWP